SIMLPLRLTLPGQGAVIVHSSMIDASLTACHPVMQKRGMMIRTLYGPEKRLPDRNLIASKLEVKL
ncbi:MAG: hypothetical protein ACXVAU_19860, partial [Mucilaginibacter sp.]